MNQWRKAFRVARDLRDCTIVITGGSSGIGAAAARILAQAGASVVITGRSDQTHQIAARSARTRTW